MNIQSNKIFKGECQYFRKENYKKSISQKKECNICFNLVNYTNNNIVTCNKTFQVVCSDCKVKINENGGICPMCRSHGIYPIVKDEVLTFYKFKEKLGFKLLNPKQKKALRNSKINKKFYGKHNQYKKNRKLYTWRVDDKYYVYSWPGSNGEYVSHMNTLQNRGNTEDYENLLELQIQGFPDSILFHAETGIIYDNVTPTDLSLEHLGIDLNELLDEINDIDEY